MTRKTRPSIPPEHRAFVAAALERRLSLDELDFRAALSRLRRDGKVSVRATGTNGSTSLPFEININARIGGDPSPARLRSSFTASVKFGDPGSNRRGRACVTKLDAAPSGRAWHLHQFAPELGCEVDHADARSLADAEFLAHDLPDALRSALGIFCALERLDDDHYTQRLFRHGAQGSPVPLVVPSR